MRLATPPHVRFADAIRTVDLLLAEVIAAAESSGSAVCHLCGCHRSKHAPTCWLVRAKAGRDELRDATAELQAAARAAADAAVQHP